MNRNDKILGLKRGYCLFLKEIIVIEDIDRGMGMIKGKYEQINGMLDMVSDVIWYIQNLNEDEYNRSADSLEEDLRYVIEAVNLELLDSPKVCFYRLKELDKENLGIGHKEELIRQCICWRDKISEILEKRYLADNVWDERFIKLMDLIQYVDFDTIVENVKNSLLSQETETISYLCLYYKMYHEMWGMLDILNDRYDVIINRVNVLKEHREDFLWLYGRLRDQRSKLVLVSMLYNWITFDRDYIRGMKEANYSDYFDLDLVRCDEKEVLVDLGAWIGDSTLNYIQTYGKYKRIYCYEIDESNMKTMKKNLSGYSDIVFRHKGVGNKNSVGYIAGSQDSSCNKITDQNIGGGKR